MPLRYQSGEEILRGDRVRLSGAEGVVDFVADPESPTPETEWFIQEYGGGAMILDSQIGSVFTSDPQNGCLEFVGRADPEVEG